jgi:hypothetical protein
MRRIALLASLTLLSFAPFAANAVLIITPSTGSPLTGDDTSQAVINTVIAGDLGGSVLLYKKDAGSLAETGSFASSYNTAFNSESDPSDATITYVGGSPVMSATHLLVKDGNHSPAWYLFDLSWNGTETIWVHDFWPKGGAISHVTLYGRGTTTTQVPEPGTMGLLGAGVLVFGFLRRRKAA